MASQNRRKSFDRINSNNRQEEAHFNNEAPSYDTESLSSLATQGDSEYAQAGSSLAGSSIDESDSGSTLTIRRGSNPLPTGGRFQPGDEPETREEEEPQNIEKRDIDRGTKFILGAGGFVVLFHVFAYLYLRYFYVPRD